MFFNLTLYFKYVDTSPNLFQDDDKKSKSLTHDSNLPPFKSESD